MEFDQEKFAMLIIRNGKRQTDIVIYTFMHHNIKDRRMKENAWRKEAGRKTQEDFFNNIITSHFICKGSKG